MDIRGIGKEIALAYIDLKGKNRFKVIIVLTVDILELTEVQMWTNANWNAF